MNKQEAIEFLSLVLPFEDKGQDYCSTLDNTVIGSINQLVQILEEEYGELTLVGRHPEFGDIYITIEMGSDVYYKTVSPSEGNFKAMQAVYALVP